MGVGTRGKCRFGNTSKLDWARLWDGESRGAGVEKRVSGKSLRSPLADTTRLQGLTGVWIGFAAGLAPRELAEKMSPAHNS